MAYYNTYTTREYRILPINMSHISHNQPQGEVLLIVKPAVDGSEIPNNHLQNLWTPVEKIGYSPYQLVSW